jgi:hypothetical protein
MKLTEMRGRRIMNLKTRARRSAIVSLATCVLSCATPAIAQAQRSYAVMALMGDKISVVTRQFVVGSSLDRNVRQELEMPDDTFDMVAVNAARDAIKREDPNAVTSLYTSRDPKLFALQDKLVDSDAQSAPLADSLRSLLAQSRATHLLLITKYRTEARLRMADGYVGNGKLMGIGFYVDPTFNTLNVNSGEKSHGFFAPFAYLKLTLIDATTLQPISQWATAESLVYGTEASKTASVPWDALTAAQKVVALRTVIANAVEDAVPHVVTAR